MHCLRNDIGYAISFALGKQLKGFKRFLCNDRCKGKKYVSSVYGKPTGRPTPLGNVAIEIPPVITVDVIRFVFTMLVVVLNRFIFLANSSRNFISSSKYALISVNFLKRYVCGSCGAVVFNCCFIVIYAHLFNSWSWRMSSRMSSSIPSAIKIVLEAINV